MARPVSKSLTGRESQVMDALWRLGDSTAEQVRGALPQPLHDSTVRTLLRVLESKGYLRHEVRGKSFVYRAVIGRQKAQRHALRDLLGRLFGGSAEDLVFRLIEDETITLEQIDQLRRAAPEPPKRAAGRRGRGDQGKGPGVSS
jgi:BlaI family penicillinase repressor